MRFEKLSDLKNVYLALKKHNSELLNESKEQITIGIAYDRRCLGESKWVGVILRNLPPKAQKAGI